MRKQEYYNSKTKSYIMTKYHETNEINRMRFMKFEDLLVCNIKNVHVHNLKSHEGILFTIPSAIQEF